MADRWKTAQFFIDAFGYRVQQEFDIDFGNGETAKCIALEPPEKTAGMPWVWQHADMTKTREEGDFGFREETTLRVQDYHTAPEIFVSDGTPDSVVGKWVAKRGGIGGIHHIAYQVDSVEKKMQEWKEKGWGEFSSPEPMRCDGLTQVFSVPHALTGIVFEFIERDEFGFCRDNVKQLMISTEKFN